MNRKFYYILFVSSLLHCLAGSLFAQDSLDTERFKYIRNFKFNDTYLDVFFRTSAGSLPMNSIFSDDNLIYKQNNLHERIPISRTKLSRRIDFTFESVPLYKLFSGEVDLTSFNILSNFFFIEKNISDSTERTLITEQYNFKPDTNIRKSNTNINLGAGNQIGSFGGHYFTSYKYLKFFIFANYLSSPGMLMSSSSPDDASRLSSTLPHSSFDNSSLFGKIFFNNGNSQVGISLFSSVGNKVMPPFMDNGLEQFLEKKNILENLVNFEFKTLMENFVDISGNVFYKNSADDLNSFDDDTYSSQENFNSYSKQSDGYRYGGIINTAIEWNKQFPTVFTFEYLREIVNRQEADNMPKNRFEVEAAGFSVKQLLYFNSFQIAASGKLNIKKPLFSDLTPISNTINSFDYKLFANWNLDKELSIIADYSYENKMPALQEIFYQGRFSVAQVSPLLPELERNASIGFNQQNSDYVLYSKLFYSSIGRIINSERNFNRELKFFNAGSMGAFGADFGFKVYSDLGFISVNYTYSSLEDKPLMFVMPKHTGEVKIYNVYSNGLRWLLEAEYYSNRFFWQDNMNNTSVEHLFLLNFRVGAKVLSKNEIFFGLYNLLDTYYESQFGIPASGISFYLGLSLNI